MAKPKNFAFGIIALASLMVSPAAVSSPVSMSAATGFNVTVDYSELSFSSTGGAPLK